MVLSFPKTIYATIHSIFISYSVNNFVCYHQLDNYDCANKTWFDHIISDILAYFVNMYFHNPSFITCHTCCSHKFEIFTISPVTTQPVTHELTRASVECGHWPSPGIRWLTGGWGCTYTGMYTCIYISHLWFMLCCTGHRTTIMIYVENIHVMCMTIWPDFIQQVKGKASLIVANSALCWHMFTSSDVSSRHSN